MRVTLRARRLVARRWGRRGMVVVMVAAIVLLVGGGAVLARLGGTTVPASSNNVDLQKGLIGWWKLDGNLKDASPYGRDAAAATTGPVSGTDRMGKTPGAMSYDGSTQCSAVSNFDNTIMTSGNQGANWTMSIWAKNVTTTSNAIALGKAGYNGGLMNTTNGYKFEIWNSSNVATSIASGAITTTQWHLLTGVYAAGSMSFYIDGQLIGTGSISSIRGYSTTLGIGCGGLNNWYYSGSLDDARVYNRVLSVAEITALYNEYDPGIKSGSGENGLVGWWKFDGNAKDSTPNADNASLINAPSLTTDRKGTSNSAYSLTSSSNQCISIPNTAGINLGTVTASVWIKTTQTPASDADFVEKWNGSGNYPYVVRLGSSGAPYVAAYDGTHNPTIGSSVTVNDGNWHMITATRAQGGAMQIYVDGVLRGTGTDNTTGADTNTSPLYIGCRGGSSQFFNGAEDDVRIYNRVLSSAEVANLYNSYNSQISLGGSNGSVQLGKGLLGYWPFNGNAKDTTPYADNGTVTGATLANDREGRAASAYLLGNSAAYINVGSPGTFTNLASSGFTYSIWLMRTTTSTYQWPEIMGASNTHIGYGIRSLNFGDSIAFEYGTSPYSGSSFSSTSSHSLPVNTWHMVTVTYDGVSAIKYYWDGALYASATSALNPTFQELNFSNTSSDWNGTIDDARVWSRPLTASEVAALYNEYR